MDKETVLMVATKYQIDKLCSLVLESVENGSLKEKTSQWNGVYLFLQCISSDSPVISYFPWFLVDGFNNLEQVNGNFVLKTDLLDEMELKAPVFYQLLLAVTDLEGTFSLNKVPESVLPFLQHLGRKTYFCGGGDLNTTKLDERVGGSSCVSDCL